MTLRDWLLGSVSLLPELADYEQRRFRLAQDGRTAMLAGGMLPDVLRQMDINQLAHAGVEAHRRLAQQLLSQVPAGTA